MVRRFTVARVVAILVSASLSATATAQPSGEMERYINGVRELRMSGGAQEQLKELAFVALGWSSIVYHKDDITGYHSATRSSTSATIPSTSEEKYAEFKKALHSLHPFADADSSGFVTRLEAGEFQTLFMFGPKVRAAVEYEGSDIGEVASALELAVSELLDRIDEYNNMARKAVASGLSGVKIVLIK